MGAHSFERLVEKCVLVLVESDQKSTRECWLISHLVDIGNLGVVLRTFIGEGTGSFLEFLAKGHILGVFLIGNLSWKCWLLARMCFEKLNTW